MLVAFIIAVPVCWILLYFLVSAQSNLAATRKELDAATKCAWEKNEMYSQLLQKYEALRRTIENARVEQSLTKAFPFVVTPEMEKAFKLYDEYTPEEIRLAREQVKTAAAELRKREPELPFLPPGVDTAAQIPTCASCGSPMNLVGMVGSAEEDFPHTKQDGTRNFRCPTCGARDAQNLNLEG